MNSHSPVGHQCRLQSRIAHLTSSLFLKSPIATARLQMQTVSKVEGGFLVAKSIIGSLATREVLFVFNRRNGPISELRFRFSIHGHRLSVSAIYSIL